ncbi:MAG: GspH/FimT family protein [Pseudomonadota bacterium]
MENKASQSGFTLVELMIVIAILGIIAAIGSTTLLVQLPAMRLKSAARDIASTMMEAKTAAIQRGVNVTVLFNTPVNGYSMFLDSGTGIVANDNNEVIDLPGETVLSVQPALPVGVSFNGATTFANNALVFTQRGIPVDAVTGGLGNGIVNLRVVDSSGNTLRQRTIAVSSAGSIRIDSN